jgi:hypothetical protein
MNNSNGVLFVTSFLANFAISERFAASVGVSVVLFVLSKLLDYFVKPAVDEWRARRRAERERR